MQSLIRKELVVKIFLVSALALSPLFVTAGENILNNPSFTLGTDGLPINWNQSYEKLLGRINIGEENGERHIVILPGRESAWFGQKDIVLNPGGRYRFGAWVKTRGLKASRQGLFFYNWAWAKDIVAPLPLDTKGEWRKVEMSVVAPDSRLSVYTLALYVDGMTAGELLLRAPFLEAEDDASAEGVERAPRTFDPDQITPVTPLLKKISPGTSRLELVCGARRGRTVCTVSVRDGTGTERPQGRFPLIGERIVAQLADMRPGFEGTLVLRLESEGLIVAEKSYPIRVLQDTKLTRQPERALNGMVTRLLTDDAVDGTKAFSAPKDGWIWISLSQGCETTKVFLDGGHDPVILCRPGERFETLRKVARGDHILRIEGASGGDLIVNAIPELFCDSFPAKYLKSYDFCSGDFIATYIYSTYTTFCYGWGSNTVSDVVWRDFYGRGKAMCDMGLFPQKWMFSKEKWKNRYESPEVFAERLRKGMTKPCKSFAGRCFDEVWINSTKEMDLYGKAMRILSDIAVPYYTWSSGYTFSETPLSAEYLSACLNVAGGEGRFLFECYPFYQSTTDEGLELYLDELLDDAIRRGNRLVPCLNPNALVVMGLYTGCGKHLFYDKLCETDPKYLMDQYVRRLATRGDFRGLGGFGIYAYGNAEEEDVRWISKVVRHYLIEGRTDSLSDRYGYQWNPGLIRNGDFRKGLAGWKVTAAAEGSVRAADVPGYGKGVQHRSHTVRQGDDVCVMRRSATRPNRLEQRLTNLVPGRLYSLRFVVSPLKEVLEKKKDMRHYAFSARVEGADDETRTMPVAAYGGAERIGDRYNQRTIVFRARTETANLILEDWENGEKPTVEGEELIISAVRIRQYYAK